MAGMLLADNGADVIAVEGGDHGPIWCRTVWDRGKRSIIVDDDQVRALADGVDVVIESQGLDHATLAATNPRLILCSITGYGRDNRHAGRPYVDALVAARMGMHWDQRGVVDGQPVRIARLPLPDPGPVPPGAEQTGHRDGPIFQALPWNSIGACLLAVTGISAALRAREVTGAGQWVETSLLQGGLLNAAPTWQRVPNPRQDGYRLPYFDRRCPKGFFRCADGRWLHQWAPIHHAFAQAAAAGPELRRPEPGELPPPARLSGYDAQLAAELDEHPRTAAAFAKARRGPTGKRLRPCKPSTIGTRRTDLISFAKKAVRLGVPMSDLSTLAPAASRALAGDGATREVRDHYHPGWVSHGVVASTPSDIARFWDALFCGGLLSAQSLHEMTTLVPIGQAAAAFHGQLREANVALDVFVVVRLMRRLGRRRAQLRRAVEDHLLVAVARRRKQTGQPLEVVGRESDLFLALTRRRRVRRFPGIDAAGRQFPEIALHTRAVLPDEDDATVVLDRDQYHAGGVANDFHLVLGSVREPGGFHFEREHSSLVDNRHRVFSLYSPAA
jgi:crotonobetainyl-CoA:carnitine CoA-transferase CaiB-like acyl-CoA transferase